MTVTWLTAFLDTPRTDSGEASLAFWQRITGWSLSPRRGDRGQFATLLPPDGDALLRVQDVDVDAASIHLDVHVADVHAASEQAAALGGRVAKESPDLVVLRSPGAFPFCLTSDEGERVRPAPMTAHHGHASLVDQVCLDCDSLTSGGCGRGACPRASRRRGGPG